MAEESILQEKLIQWLNALPNVFNVKIIAANRAGTPDVVLCVKGMFIALECKSEKGEQSKLQKYFQNKIERAGGVYYIVRPSNLSQIKNQIIYFLK